MLAMPLYAIGQIIIDSDSGGVSGNKENDNDRDATTTTTTTSSLVDISSEHHRPMISPSTHSSLFSDFFNLQDDFFDNVFRKDFRSFIFPSLLDNDESDNLFERNFFFQSPFDDLATSLRGHRGDYHGRHPTTELAAVPHAFLRGGIGSNVDDFFSSIRPTAIELVDDDTTFQVSMRLPKETQVKDIDVHLDDSGTRLVVEGHTSTTNDNSDNVVGPTNVETTTTSQHFVQSFLVDPKVVEVDRFVASVKDGQLTISAPKDPRKIKNVHHTIPVLNLDDARSIEPPSGLISDAAQYVQGLSTHDAPVENEDHLSEEFESIKDELTRKRNDQMSKFTKLDIDEGKGVGNSNSNRRPSSLQIEDHDPNNIIRENANNWREVSETTL
jgi:HSP20 family molecular chaperone IbpA